VAKSLVIVESPAKARTIERFLGRGYEVAASMGHVRDLPKSQLGVDIEHGFTPRYITIRGRGEIIGGLRQKAKKASRVLLATDPDREGEAISWHLCHALGLDEAAPRRIAFHEITKEAVTHALRDPRPIDQRLVDAQQARRVLDRLVGYQLSPLLWRKVRGGLSAGRVQSVAVRLICDRETEIAAFVPEEYWTITARCDQGGQPFTARYFGDLPAGGDGERAERRALHSREEVDAVLAGIGRGPLSVLRVTRRERRRNPAPPFTTATLQQEAARKLGFTVRRTMRLAQELYEGLAVGGEHVGLITYMRTDSVRVAASAVAEAERYVQERWGADHAAPRQGRAAEGAQDAHEAVRPTSVLRTPESLQPFLSRDQLRLYRLVWERFVASQMAPAVFEVVTADIAAPGGHLLRASGSVVRFRGFTVLYVEGKDPQPAQAEEAEEDAERALPPLRAGDRPQLLGCDPAQHFTEPPPRYTEAMLVRALEEKGIGRPSTYAAIIETIAARGYVEKEQRRFRPTPLGVVVTDLLREHFPSVVDVEFTAGMERELDAIETGDLPWRQVVEGFYGPFAERLAAAEEAIGRVELPEETTDEVCPTCGRPMVVKRGRFGPFLACSGYPECRTTRPLAARTGVRCPRCGQGELLERRSRRGRTFYGCERYPDCEYVLWERPVGTCPECGQPLVEKRGRRQEEGVRRCVNPDCGHVEAAPGEEAGEGALGAGTATARGGR
jgi:DNA topoisomerase-1